MPVATRERPKMTAEDAQHFDRYSVGNAARALSDLRESGTCKGQCQPYQDIFTFARWRAQGYSVMKGQHGARLPVVIEMEGEGGTKNTRLWISYVFCRCQVAAKENGANVLQHIGAR